VIPTYNRKGSLLRTLDALARQTLPANRFEVVVVSDGSTDGSADAVRSRAYPYRIRYLEQTNGGPSVARNHGARAACGGLIVFVDDDIEPAHEFLEVHATAHAADELLVLIGPQSMPPGERFPIWVEWEGRMLERQYARFRSGEWSAGPNNLYSGNFSVRREHLIAVGGFDEQFNRQEDVELGYRLEAHGLHFQFAGGANGYHRPERSFESWYQTPYLYGVRDVQMARDKGQEQALTLAQKHYRERNALTRLLARVFIGRPGIGSVLFMLLKPAIPACDRLGFRGAGLALCSLTFNLRYLQGMANEMGGPRAMWNSLRISTAIGEPGG
jgi:GT2 family glycosyltransferase